MFLINSLSRYGVFFHLHQSFLERILLFKVQHPFSFNNRLQIEAKKNNSEFLFSEQTQKKRFLQD